MRIGSTKNLNVNSKESTPKLEVHLVVQIAINHRCAWLEGTFIPKLALALRRGVAEGRGPLGTAEITGPGMTPFAQSHTGFFGSQLPSDGWTGSLAGSQGSLIHFSERRRNHSAYVRVFSRRNRAHASQYSLRHP